MDYHPFDLLSVEYLVEPFTTLQLEPKNSQLDYHNALVQCSSLSGTEASPFTTHGSSHHNPPLQYPFDHDSQLNTLSQSDARYPPATASQLEEISTPGYRQLSTEPRYVFVAKLADLFSTEPLVLVVPLGKSRATTELEKQEN